MARYDSLYANTHRANVRKSASGPPALRLVGEKPRAVPSKDWAEMNRKVSEADKLIRARCGRNIKPFTFLMGFAPLDRIFGHLK